MPIFERFKMLSEKLKSARFYTPPKYFAIFLITVFLSLFLIWGGIFSCLRQQFEIDFFDIGQGDSMLINIPYNQQILIDGGPDSKVLNSLGEKMPFYDRTIELIILTHPHSDHINGLIDVLSRYKVEKILLPKIENKPAEKDTESLDEFMNLAKKKSIPVFFADQGQEIIVNEEIKGEILWPLKNFQSDNLNDFSVILKLDYKNFCAYFTGDAEAVIQQQILSAENLSECQLLKVPHHGSKTALEEDFLKKINSKMAVISVGKNSYGHPAQETLEKLESQKIKYFRTDQDGIIRIGSDGINFWRK